ncbi:uncharacterized protein [Misgurnus anguillicaudatus]|uniref:uncharacterized protein n=1 Tax=Misgurnus anguillicaudatus TaxID=75329 RepID=UPI003CCF68B4
MPGSTIRQCPHCQNKMNCRNRRCVKCGKLLDFKNRQSMRLAKFRAQASQWAKTTIKSRNQSKVLDNLAVMMEKLKALGYLPVLLLGKSSKAQKWTAEVQCPFEFPPEGHGVIEKMLILFEHILQGFSPEKELEVTEGDKAEGQDLNKTIEDEEDIRLKNNIEVEILEDEEQMEEQQIESGKGESDTQEGEPKNQEVTGDEAESQDLKGTVEDEEDILFENKVDVEILEEEEQIEEQQSGEREPGIERKNAEQEKRVKRKIRALEMEERREMERRENNIETGAHINEEVILEADCKSAVNMVAKRKRRKKMDTECQFHEALDVFPVESFSKRRVRKGRKEVLVHWQPCPSCKKTWPPTWEPEDHVQITLTQC